MRIKVIIDDFIKTLSSQLLISHHKKTQQRKISDTCYKLQIPFLERFNYILLVFFFLFFFNIMYFFNWLLLGFHSLSLSFFFFWIICIFNSFWLCWVFIALLRFFLVAASGTLSGSMGFSCFRVQAVGTGLQ